MNFIKRVKTLITPSNADPQDGEIAVFDELGRIVTSDTNINLPVVTEYPTTDPAKAGTRFWYKGNEWHYMTQEEIDSTGWTGIVDLGFPAPVNKRANSFVLFGDNSFFGGPPSLTQSGIEIRSAAKEINFIGFNPNFVQEKKLTFNLPSNFITTSIEHFRNAHLLVNLEDVGTSESFRLNINGNESVLNINPEVLNDFFTQLPPTNKTVTLNISVASGSATCDPTIATAKGYTVTT